MGMQFKGLSALIPVAALALAGGSASGVVITTSGGVGADSYIGNSTENTTNFGSAATMSIRTDASRHRVAYIRFDLGNAGVNPAEVVSATFEVTTASSNTPGNFLLDVFGMNDGLAGEAWSEASLTYATASPLPNFSQTNFGGAQGTVDMVYLGTLTMPTNAAGQLLSLSNTAVRDFIAADTNGSVTFLITSGQVSGSTAQLRTKEDTANGTPPRLTVVVPEPASLGLLGLAGVALLRRRQH
ncbi:DNRLRE domain-containing protein [Oscillatoria amoena NRMC-F 0135]|nr:DNRLRE domain-containing protein [Oscillatoria amoena NRMC-F 0135]